MNLTPKLSALVLLATTLTASAQTSLDKSLQSIDQTIAQGPFKPEWSSLKSHQDPEWFRDAKFGIYTHWGPVTVGTEDGGAQWYGNSMYILGTASFASHQKKFGDQKNVGFKDIIPKLTAEKFNADAWADLFAKAGAKFAGPVAVHHDNFSMWDSQLTRWNSVKMGPHRDITGELEKAIRAHGMKFITTFHHGFAWRYFEPSFQYDGADPKNADLYTEFHLKGAPPSKQFQDLWLAKVYEVLNKYQPDLIWFDFEFFKVIQPEYQQKLFAMAYDWAAENKRTIGVCQKDGKIHESTSILDFERGRADRITPYPWLTDTVVGDWFCVKNAHRKSVDQLVSVLVDIVSKNGCLLLDVGPAVDGTIMDQDRQALLGMGAWLKVNGEAIYSTRPWKIYGEGPTQQAKTGGFSEHADKPFTSEDIRFTQSKDGKILYATALGIPKDGKIVIKSLALPAGKISDISLIGYSGKLEWKQTADALLMTLPSDSTAEHAISFKILAGELTPVEVKQSIVTATKDANILTVTLSLANAEIHGKTPLDSGKETHSVPWADPKDSLSWNVKIDQAGTYGVFVTYSSLAGGSDFIVEAGTQKFQGKTSSTASWSSYRRDNLGEFFAEKSGNYTVSLKANDKASWNGMGVKTITLERIE